MINWMQKHRKALVPAIWISTIAFVGAGFVGWGAYSMKSDTSSAVAKVGDTAISLQEFQIKYNNLYNYINSISDGNLTQTQADEMGLDMIAYASIINDTMWLNFANELGIGVSDEDVAKYLVTMPEFQLDGAFDKNLYLNTLARLGIKPVDFEENLAKNVILDKLNHALNLPVNKNEIEALSSSFFMEDKLELNIIEVNPDDINITEPELKEFWEKTKDSYKTLTSYELDVLNVRISDMDVKKEEVEKYYEENKNLYRNPDDTIMDFESAKLDVLRDYKLENSKDDALKAYIALKNDEMKTTEKLTVKVDDVSFPLEEIVDEKVGEFIKPIVYKDGYLVVRVSKINTPETMNYEEAKELAKADFRVVKIENELDALANKTLESFSGKDIGFVSKNSVIEGLSELESSIFLNELFNTANASKGYVKFENKAFVYNIVEQRLVNQEKLDEYKDVLVQNAAGLKNLELKTSISNLLEKRYKVEQYYKGSSLE
ncbi:MAG: hypothetical protein GX282_04345 [Campylobacteraceae bacterium]|nr:hypothetical protein [Campylobacteraceae bacterium]